MTIEEKWRLWAWGERALRLVWLVIVCGPRRRNNSEMRVELRGSIFHGAFFL